MRKRLLLGSLVALILLAALAVPAAAQQERPGKLVLGGAYSLETGQRLNGDLGVAGGTATIQEGAAVQGDVIVLGGSLEVAGTITGDMAIFGGSVELANSAVVNGEVSYFGGSFDRAEGAVVTGQVRQGMELDFPGWRGIPLVPGSGAAATAPEPSLRTSPGQWLLGLVLRILRAIALTLALAGLALILSLFWPKGVQLIGQTAAEQPAIALLAGLLTWAIAGSAGILMAVTICLLPLALLLALVMVVAALVAWIATGWIVGRKLFAVLNVQSPTTVVEATTGTIILAAVYFLVSTVGCLAFVYGLLVASFGLARSC